MIYNQLPEDLKAEMYAYLDIKSASERKPGMTDEQFYYKTRKNAIGPFKAQTWQLPEDVKAGIAKELESQFARLFNSLGIRNTRRFVDQTIHPVVIKPSAKYFLGGLAGEEDVSDLAD